MGNLEFKYHHLIIKNLIIYVGVIVVTILPTYQDEEYFNVSKL